MVTLTDNNGDNCAIFVVFVVVCLYFQLMKTTVRAWHCEHVCFSVDDFMWQMFSFIKKQQQNKQQQRTPTTTKKLVWSALLGIGLLQQCGPELIGFFPILAINKLSSVRRQVVIHHHLLPLTVPPEVEMEDSCHKTDNMEPVYCTTTWHKIHLKILNHLPHHQNGGG